MHNMFANVAQRNLYFGKNNDAFKRMLEVTLEGETIQVLEVLMEVLMVVITL